jgi:hypothetical protein
MTKLRKKSKGEAGFIQSLELVFLGTIVLCTVIIGWSSFGSKLVGEMADLGSAVGSLNQSYSMTGMAVGHPTDPVHPQDVATWSGSSYSDTQDYCDNDPNCACGVRVCIPPTPEVPHVTPTP